MIEGFEILNNEFNRIKSLGWIKGISNGFGNGGKTFEYMLGKRGVDEIPAPDYYGVEIKTRSVNSIYKIGLFSVVPDGPGFFEIKRIVDKFGHPAIGIPTSKVLNGYVSANNKQFIGKNYQFSLEVDRSEERVYLLVFDKDSHLLERNSYWSFDLLRERVELKLPNLALVKVRGRMIGGENYYSYQNITFYRLKSFEKFIELLEQGIITMVINIGVHRDEKHFGQIHDHGTGLQIEEKHLSQLFNIVDI